ncbi:MAG: 16S rRNA (cytosine(967)-C(5))-methyltransferase RsmB [Candidatus Carbobacillus altaicus]|uniref:16S rRNA (cytosine(967)-C(5))-methyltransferase n=1 Tax=Candidatus Carbonibacillus altaicus TaxID=2163959 RepID=A0A2R6Y171_9BACL|nr:16S rRNA (cytosine(967)-C(5))-methyltransferase RsmB [Candidatus Carbobacillus altaicus]PTQ56382.1 MAG: Ribosomal RNA small subunit methyltransferase B [Candidatus Carbobacillus altaicus]
MLRRIDAKHAFSNVLVRKWLDTAHLSAEDRALVTELVYGVLSWQQALDEKIAVYLNNRTLDAVDPGLLTILRLTFYQRLYLTRIPSYAAVHEAVTLARKTHGEGSARFVNAVLRALERDLARTSNKASLRDDRVQGTLGEKLASRYAHPAWLVKMWLERYGKEQTEALLYANQTKAPLFVRLRTKGSEARESLFLALKKDGIAYADIPGLSEALLIHAPVGAIRPYLEQGLLVVQDISAMLVVRALRLIPGLRILDAASAPGGKTLQIIDVLKEATESAPGAPLPSEVIANEKHPRKAETLKKRLEDELVRDAFAPIRVQVVNQDAATLTPFQLGTFDRILLDAPCSGLGTIRRKPEIKWRLFPETLGVMQKTQSALLLAMAPLLKSDGRIVYSTCTLSPQENEQVIHHFLQERPDYVLDETLLDDLPLLPGLYPLAPGMVEIHPTVQGGDGFFIARLKHATQ